MIQGSEEWKRARLGLVTSSRLGDLMARTKSGPAASRTNYMMDLLIHRLTGEYVEHFTTKEMQWGTDTEPMARAEYEVRTGLWVEQTGFKVHDDIGQYGGSPDGLIPDGNGLIEIKCPNTATHLDTLFKGTIKRQYILQMQSLMDIFQRDWCDFVSYDPRLPEQTAMRIIRVEREDNLITEISTEVVKFLNELRDLEEKAMAYETTIYTKEEKQ